MNKLEQILEHLVNEEHEQADALLHDFIVAKAREIYENVMAEDEVKDETADFTTDIISDQADIDADHEFASQPEDAEHSEEEGEQTVETVSDEVEALRAELEQLKAEFDLLRGEEMQEPEHADIADEMADLEANEDDLQEATSFATEVNVDMSKEGRLVGTGAHSKVGAVTTKSPVANSRVASDAKATQFAKASAQGKEADKTAAKSGLPGVEPKTKEMKVDLSREGRQVANGKVAGATQTRSPIGSK